jgi:LysM repeat protein
VLVGLAVALAVGFLGGRAGAGPAHPSVARVYVVHPGDTLWGIARSVVGPSGDPRPLVDRLVAVNHLAGGTIAPGERLSIPAD